MSHNDRNPSGWPAWQSPDPAAWQPAFDRLPVMQAVRHGCVLLREITSGTCVAWLADPLDEDRVVWLESLVDGPLPLRVGRREDIDAYLAAHDHASSAVDAALEGLAGGAGNTSSAERLNLASMGESASPAVRIVNSTLFDAIKLGVSDVHFESTPEGLQCKYRIDGVLNDASLIQGPLLQEQIVSRIKVLAELDIAEHRVPQDGSFQVEVFGRRVDLRISVMPSIHGEDVVIRVLDKRSMLGSAQSLTLDTVGFDAATLRDIRALTRRPYGMFLVAGPTGSGKTTTLYGALSELNNRQDKTITIEDPVEYQLPGVVQIPINEKKGLTFARGLRSILRHDPDRIMVGEIRDGETAEIAIQSSLTGHMVFSSVHANSAPDVFGRFANLGVELGSFAAALNGVCAQRLLRMNCRHCARPDTPPREQLDRHALARSASREGRFMRGAGCEACRGTGYAGRTAIAEVLRLDADLREMVAARQWGRPLLEHARTQGYRSMFEAALERVYDGQTTLEEVERVVLEN